MAAANMTMGNGTEGDLLVLPALLDLAAAEGFLAAMRRRVQQGAQLRLDARGVALLTSPCIQILLAAARGPAQLSIEQPSDVFVSAFADLGLDLQALLKPSESEPEDRSADIAPAGDASCLPAQAEERPVTKRILTIDDSKTIRDMLMLTLADAGFQVLQAVDGQDGMDVLGTEPVDVVITDINMPRMDGYEVIRRLRRSPAHRSTPILVLTTESEAEKKHLAREVGATGWMVKPFDPEKLVATIHKVAP